MSCVYIKIICNMSLLIRNDSVLITWITRLLSCHKYKFTKQKKLFKQSTEHMYLIALL